MRVALGVRLALAATCLLLIALAGCGGGSTTTVIDRTVTETTPESTTTEATTPESTPSGSNEPPTRVIHLSSFQSPSGNIGCVIISGSARCDIAKRDWSPPAHPASCPSEVDFGQGLEVGGSGAARFVCAGDTALNPSADQLQYRTASRVGGLTCVSRSDGITCTNSSGHGFFISIQAYRTF